MALWLVVVVGIVCVLIGCLFGLFLDRIGTRHAGTFIIDKENPETNGGVYTVFDIDPLQFHDHQNVYMDVLVVDLGKQSQQNQPS